MNEKGWSPRFEIFEIQIQMPATQVTQRVVSSAQIRWQRQIHQRQRVDRLIVQSFGHSHGEIARRFALIASSGRNHNQLTQRAIRIKEVAHRRHAHTLIGSLQHVQTQCVFFPMHYLISPLLVTKTSLGSQLDRE